MASCVVKSHIIFKVRKKIYVSSNQNFNIITGFGIVRGMGENHIIYFIFIFLKRVTNDYFYVTRDLFLVR